MPWAHTCAGRATSASAMMVNARTSFLMKSSLLSAHEPACADQLPLLTASNGRDSPVLTWKTRVRLGWSPLLPLHQDSRRRRAKRRIEADLFGRGQ